MLHKSVLSLVSYFQQRGIIQLENAEWCVYVVERKVITVTFFVVIFLLGCLITQPWNVLMILLCISQIRKWSGGYHCTSIGRCFLLSAVIVLGGILLAILVEDLQYVQVLLAVLGTCFLVKAPVDQPELHLSRIEISENRKRLRFSQAVILVLAVLGILFHLTIITYGIVGYFIASISVLAAHLLYGKRRMYYEYSE